MPRPPEAATALAVVLEFDFLSTREFVRQATNNSPRNPSHRLTTRRGFINIRQDQTSPQHVHIDESAPLQQRSRSRPGQARSGGDGARARIRSGKLRFGARLQSENELGKRFAVSRATVRKGLEALVGKGLIKTKTGIGSFVTFDGETLDNALGWTRALSLRRRDIETRVLRIEIIEDPALARVLQQDIERFIAIDRRASPRTTGGRSRSSAAAYPAIASSRGADQGPDRRLAAGDAAQRRPRRRERGGMGGRRIPLRRRRRSDGRRGGRARAQDDARRARRSSPRHRTRRQPARSQTFRAASGF